MEKLNRMNETAPNQRKKKLIKTNSSWNVDEQKNAITLKKKKVFYEISIFRCYLDLCFHIVNNSVCEQFIMPWIHLHAIRNQKLHNQHPDEQKLKKKKLLKQTNNHSKNSYFFFFVCCGRRRLKEEKNGAKIVFGSKRIHM